MKAVMCLIMSWPLCGVNRFYFVLLGGTPVRGETVEQMQPMVYGFTNYGVKYQGKFKIAALGESGSTEN